MTIVIHVSIMFIRSETVKSARSKPERCSVLTVAVKGRGREIRKREALPKKLGQVALSKKNQQQKNTFFSRPRNNHKEPSLSRRKVTTFTYTLNQRKPSHAKTHQDASGTGHTKMLQELNHMT